jgi:hypothetical protein
MAVALSIAIRRDLRSRMVVTPVTGTRRNSHTNSLFYSENTTLSSFECQSYCNKARYSKSLHTFIFNAIGIAGILLIQSARVSLSVSPSCF